MNYIKQMLLDWKVHIHILFFIYSLSGIISKNAGKYEMFSIGYLVSYCLAVGILGMFTIVWQIILKKERLSDVYMYKAMTVVWGNVFGFLIFKETISWGTVVGIVFILAGIYFVGMPDGEKA